MVDCRHSSVLRLDGNIHGFYNPLTCDDCGAIIECEHLELDLDYPLPCCMDCGDLLI